MPKPEGYRKALRAMQVAGKFGRPILTFLDTPGAYPGIDAEERGQAEAIARNLREMARLPVPVIVVCIGEGGSGGALALGVGNLVLMLENAVYSVISPESCASIIYRDAGKGQQAAASLKLTAEDLQGFGLIDEIVPEPPGGAQEDPAAAAELSPRGGSQRPGFAGRYDRQPTHRSPLRQIPRHGQLLRLKACPAPHPGLTGAVSAPLGTTPRLRDPYPSAAHPGQPKSTLASTGPPPAPAAGVPAGAPEGPKTKVQTAPAGQPGGAAPAGQPAAAAPPPAVATGVGPGKESSAPGGSPGPEGAPPAPRKPVTPPAYGREVNVAVPGEQTSYPARYAIREASDVQPSHNAFSFEPNPDYEHRNDRDYRSAGNAARVAEQAGRFDPNYLTMESATAEHGAPVIDERGNVLGGSSRAMTLARVYQSHSEAAAAYRTALRDRAAGLGIEPAEVDRFKNPVLVREVNGPVDAQRAITDFNKAGAAALSPAERAVKDGKRLSPETVEQLGARIGDVGERLEPGAGHARGWRGGDPQPAGEGRGADAAGSQRAGG